MVATRGSESLVEFQRCVLLSHVFLALVLENASLKVTDSAIKGEHLLRINFNVEGKVELRRNRLRCPPIILIDEISERPKTDLKDVSYEDYLGYFHLYPSDKQRSGFTRATNELWKENPKKNARLLRYENTTFFKYCAMCHNFEDNESYLYCSSCRRVCYCSRVCQKKHWRDHKLSCAGRPGTKKAPG